jgi:hypothetical protein
MTFSHLNRRVHLYLGLALLPWFFMYGISSVPFAHNQYFERREAVRGLALWTLRATHDVDAAIPANSEDLRAFGAGRQSPTQVNVYVYSFWRSTQLKYFADQKRLTVEDRRFRWDHFLTGMHARGGFEQEALLVRSWSVVVDLVCAAIVLWIASGLYMWWGLPGSRRWGWLAIVTGTMAFVVFTWRL